MNVLKLVEIGLRLAPAHGGLVVPGECGCLIDDLSPGNCMTENCLAGYKHTHSTSGEWIVSTKRDGVTDEEIAETVAQCG